MVEHGRNEGIENLKLTHNAYNPQIFDLHQPFFRKPLYSRVQKGIENFIFRPKMAIFQREGIREGGLPLPLAFKYLILMI